MPVSHLKFVRTLDFDVLNGLGARTTAEIRDICRRTKLSRESWTLDMISWLGSTRV
jgi:hypothetical protein